MLFRVPDSHCIDTTKPSMTILSALAADPNVSPAFRAAIAPQQHSAACGWRRVYLSASDARQYERGYGHWPAPMPAEVALSTPYSESVSGVSREISTASGACCCIRKANSKVRTRASS